MNVTAFDILKCLFEPNEKVCFRIFDDKKRGTFTGMKLEMPCGKYASIENELKKHNALDRGIFYVVNFGGQTDAEIERINAQFVEMDEGSFEEQQAKIDSFKLPPSMIIRTQKSLHTYWFVDKTAEVSRFRSIQQQLVNYFNGDPACVNESRVMRLPGFNHCKKDTPVEVVCISFHPERRYSQNQLSELLPQLEEKVPEENIRGSEKGLNMVIHECDFIKHCRDNAVNLSEHDWYAMITNLAVFDGGAELIHEYSSAYPKYNKNDTQQKINHFLSSGTRPIKCQTIAEKGYKCPKLLSGECNCKAPAAVCYQPMSFDTLRDIVAELPVSDNAAENFKTASAFIKEYMYNQDIVMKVCIIDSELKEHFKFKGAYLKSLEAMFKDITKEYQAGLSRRKHKVESDLPLWYVPMPNGIRFLPGILAENLTKTEQVVYAAEQHYAYKGGVYQPIDEMEAQRICQKNMLPSETKMYQIVDAEKQWRLLTRKSVREINANPYIINVKNGLYNVLEDSLEEHNPDYLSTVQLAVNYDKNADCPRFKQFLAESMGGDMEQVALIQEILGYFLIPVTSAQKCFVIVGAAGAGKSLLLRVINELLLSKENVSNVSWQALNERFKTAELFGKLANIFADLPTKNIDDNGIFKALVGEDFLTAEKKNRNPFSFQSTARLLFSCNSIPKNYGDRSEGFYRRLIIIRFNHTVPKEKRDPKLLDKFRYEADGIFMFALEGLKRLMDNDFNFSETKVNEEELQNYREESDSVLAFVKECCIVDTGMETGSTELFNAYKSYCEECGMKPYAQRTFVATLMSAYPGISKGKDKLGKRRTLRGIKVEEI